MKTRANADPGLEKILGGAWPEWWKVSAEMIFRLSLAVDFHFCKDPSAQKKNNPDCSSGFYPSPTLGREKDHGCSLVAVRDSGDWVTDSCGEEAKLVFLPGCFRSHSSSKY